jgi:hypothetical protein
LPVRLDSTSRKQKEAIVMQFLPSTHGFKFRNGWEGWPLPGELQVLGVPIPPPTKSFGLCGGMSAAAWDYFVAKVPIPTVETAPGKGTGLFNFLYNRQVRTFGVSPTYTYMLKFMNWMARPLNQTPYRGGMEGIRQLTRAQYADVQRELAEQGFAVIGLVRVKASETVSIWKNHQVLVYSTKEIRDHRESSTSKRKIILRVYDPNHQKRDDITIECDEVVVGRTLVKGNDVYGFSCVQRVPAGDDEVVRGFFLMKHTRVTPPAKIAAPPVDSATTVRVRAVPAGA